MEQLKKFIRQVPDFPRKGITFYDVTTLFENPVGFNLALSALEELIKPKNANRLVGVEARGFVVGAALADRLKLPFSLARKPGKLPYDKISESYNLEYGSNRLEMHVDSVKPGERVVVVDDLIATGGTLAAACKLVERMEGEVISVASIIGLTFLPFGHKLAGYNVDCLISYDSE